MVIKYLCEYIFKTYHLWALFLTRGLITERARKKIGEICFILIKKPHSTISLNRFKCYRCESSMLLLSDKSFYLQGVPRNMTVARRLEVRL